MSFSPDHFLSGNARPFLRISGLTPSGYGVSILTSAILMAFSYHFSRYSSCSPALAGSLSNGDFSFGECHIHSYSAQPPTSSAVVPACLQFIFLLLPPPFCINLRSTSASCLQYLLQCPLPSSYNDINISIHPTLLRTSEDLRPHCKGFSTILAAVANTTLHVPTPQSLIRRFSHELADPACG